MTQSIRTVLRAAVLIHEHLTRRDSSIDSIRLPEYTWQQIQRLQRQALLARQRGWHLANKVLCRELVDSLQRLQYELNEARGKAETHRTSQGNSSPADIFRDLRALPREFDDVEIDFTQQELTVTTDPIVLEHIDFGRFDIRLAWKEIGSAKQPYRVVALDPRPAARNESVTHPHVQEERLCEGDGRASVASALADGRLYDFFTLVSQILHTYGRGSAYVEINRWDGAVCEECGDTMDEEDRYSCQHCDSTLCSSCAVSCNGCQNSYCSECRRSCAACGEDYCTSCLAVCRQCRKRFCDECLTEGLCPSCYSQTHEEDQDDDSCNDLQCEEPGLVGQNAKEPATA